MIKTRFSNTSRKWKLANTSRKCSRKLANTTLLNPWFWWWRSLIFMSKITELQWIPWFGLFKTESRCRVSVGWPDILDPARDVTPNANTHVNQAPEAVAQHLQVPGRFTGPWSGCPVLPHLSGLGQCRDKEHPFGMNLVLFGYHRLTILWLRNLLQVTGISLRIPGSTSSLFKCSTVWQHPA